MANVILSEAEFKKLIEREQKQFDYIIELETANSNYREEIREFNEKFAKADNGKL